MQVEGIEEAKFNGEWHEVVGDYSFEGVDSSESGLKLEGVGNVPFMLIEDTK